MIEYNIAKQYTEIPGPRYESEGEFSGENFRNAVLKKLIVMARQENKKILIDLDGGYGYPTSFLEEAFGGIIRDLKDKTLIDLFVFKSDEEPLLVKEIMQYMEDAIKLL